MLRLIQKHRVAALVAGGLLVIAAAGGLASRRPPRRDTFLPQVLDYKSDVQGMAGVPLRPIDLEIFEGLAKGEFQQADFPDVFPKKPYRVRLVGDSSKRRITYVMIDFDRNGTWDEHWEIRENDVFRLASTPPETPFRLRSGRWLPF